MSAHEERKDVEINSNVMEVDNREDDGDEDDDDDKSRDGKGVLEKFFCGSPLQGSFNSINCPMPAFQLHFLPFSTQFSAKNILELDLQIIKLPSVQVVTRVLSILDRIHSYTPYLVCLNHFKFLCVVC